MKSDERAARAALFKKGRDRVGTLIAGGQPVPEPSKPTEPSAKPAEPVKKTATTAGLGVSDSPRSAHKPLYSCNRM